MPQMMPINWLIMMMFFIVIFIIFNIMNYYTIKMNKNHNLNNNLYFKNMYWKW